MASSTIKPMKRRAVLVSVIVVIMTSSGVAARSVICRRGPDADVVLVRTTNPDWPYAAKGSFRRCDAFLLPSRSEFELRLRPGARPMLSESTNGNTTVRVRAAVLGDARSGWYEIETVRHERVVRAMRRTVSLPITP